MDKAKQKKQAQDELNEKRQKEVDELFEKKKEIELKLRALEEEIADL